MKIKIIFGLALSTLVVANPIFKFNNTHEHMADEELKSVFQTERHNGMKNFDRHILLTKSNFLIIFFSVSSTRLLCDSSIRSKVA